MLKEWQFDVLFWVGVGGAVFLLVAPIFGLDATKNPTALTGIGAILTYILTQKKAWVKPADKKEEQPKEKGDAV